MIDGFYGQVDLRDTTIATMKAILVFGPEESQVALLQLTVSSTWQGTRWRIVGGAKRLGNRMRPAHSSAAKSFATLYRAGHDVAIRDILLAVLPVSVIGCAVPGAATVRITGTADQAKLVLKYVRAAEHGKTTIFQDMTGRSVDTTFTPPTIADVDRTDEGCVLASRDAALRMVSAIWTCRSNSKQNVQRVPDRGRPSCPYVE